APAASAHPRRRGGAKGRAARCLPGRSGDHREGLVIARVGALVALLVVAVAAPEPALALRPIPNTTGAVHVWDDQLPDSMSDAQIRFVARHVDGTQKVSLQTARRLRVANRGFLVLYYRLG